MRVLLLFYEHDGVMYCNGADCRSAMEFVNNLDTEDVSMDPEVFREKMKQAEALVDAA